MKRYGSELIFISRIFGNGKQIEIIEDIDITGTSTEELYELNSLSISNGTYIASGISTYVVKLKNPPKKPTT